MNDHVPLDENAPDNLIEANIELGAHPTYSLAPDIDMNNLVMITSNDGRMIFAICSDGSIMCPDDNDIPEAAQIFWREVMALAEANNWSVRRPMRHIPDMPSINPEGWDS